MYVEKQLCHPVLSFKRVHQVVFVLGKRCQMLTGGIQVFHSTCCIKLILVIWIRFPKGGNKCAEQQINKYKRRFKQPEKDQGQQVCLDAKSFSEPQSS